MTECVNCKFLNIWVEIEKHPKILEIKLIFPKKYTLISYMVIVYYHINKDLCIVDKLS